MEKRIKMRRWKYIYTHTQYYGEITGLIKICSRSNDLVSSCEKHFASKLHL